MFPGIRTLRRSKILYNTLSSAFVCFLFIFYLHYSDKNEIIGSLGYILRLASSNHALPGPTADNNKSVEVTQGLALDNHNVELVVSSMKNQDTSWYSTYFPDWKSNIYVVNDPSSSLTVPRYKGHEAMTYLTIIIDRYDTLPNNILFLHAERFQWHNDDPDYDGIPLLRNFRFAYLQDEGYVNLRCEWLLGCPVEFRPLKEQATSNTQHNDEATGEIFRQVFEDLHLADDDHPVPAEIGVSCCAQFAVTKETIQQRPRSDYIRYREWLLDTSFQDELSGRFFEYSWHIIFGKDPVYCPSAAECYCKVYGMCDLPNCSMGQCETQYSLPAYATLPWGWPRRGWKGEARAFSGPL